LGIDCINTSKKFLYSWIRPTSGCDFHRIVCPFRWLGEEEEFINYDIDLSVNDPIHEYNYYLTHGSSPISLFPDIANWKRKGGTWILSLDDDYYNVPDWSPACLNQQQLDTYYLNVEFADLIISSTPHLTKQIGKENITLTAPNLTQVDDYLTNSPAPVGDGPLRILWSGSTTHSGDLEIIEDAISEVLKKWTWPKVEFIFVGYCPNKLIKKHLYKGVHFENGVGLGLYPQVLHKIKPHITLAPLADITFNHSKSAIRIQEGWALASAVVSSPVGEYDLIRNSVDGLKAKTKEEWVDCLNSLISNRELREYVATNGRKRVAEEYSWENPACREPWRKVVRELIHRVNPQQ
jgi:glycosyltransferase involved in cell wall biosynthesis